MISWYHDLSIFSFTQMGFPVACDVSFVRFGHANGERPGRSTRHRLFPFRGGSFVGPQPIVLIDRCYVLLTSADYATSVLQRVDAVCYDCNKCFSAIWSFQRNPVLLDSESEQSGRALSEQVHCHHTNTQMPRNKATDFIPKPCLMKNHFLHSILFLLRDRRTRAESGRAQSREGRKCLGFTARRGRR